MRNFFDAAHRRLTGCNKRRVLAGLSCVVALFAAKAYADAIQDSYVIAGGGGNSSGESFTLDGTIGQGAAGVNLSGRGFAIEGGFHHIVTTPKPSVTLNQAIIQTDPASQLPINFTVTFSEPVTGFAESDLTLSGTAPGTKTITIAGTGASYSVAVSGITGDGTVIATVKADAAVGVTSGLGSLASTSTDNSITIVLPRPPTLTDITPSIGAFGTTVNVTLTGTNFATGATTIDPIPDLTVSGASVVNSTSMVATFAIDAGAALGPRNVTVITAGGTSGPAAFTVVAPFPDLRVTSSHAGTFGVGFNEAYTVEVSNAGSSTSGPYTVTDVLPAGLTFVSAIGEEWSCSVAGQTISCSHVPGLAVGATAPPLTVTVTVSAPAAPSVTHVVSVNTAGDPITSNNSAIDATPVAPVPSPVFTFNPNPPLAGQAATVGVRLPSVFPHEVTGTVTLSFTPDATLPDDPAVQFAGGGTTVNFRIPQNTLEAIFGSSPVAGPIGFQTGTVAGTLDFSGVLHAGGAEVPFAAGGSGFVISAGPPDVLMVSATTETQGPDAEGRPQKLVTARITLVSTLREVTEVTLTFRTSPKVQLSCGITQGCSTNDSSITFQVKDLFDDFFATTSNGLASLRLPLLISGSVRGAILITLSNSQGVSDVALFGLP